MTYIQEKKEQSLFFFYSMIFIVKVAMTRRFLMAKRK
jgi:hypothetical protein